MNNQIFDINRFAKVFVREFNRYKIKLLGILAVFLGIFVLSIVYSLVYDTTPLKVSFSFMGRILIIIAPIVFSRNINRINAIFDYTLPASSFERFLVKWILCVIIMPLLIALFLLLVAGLYYIVPGGNCSFAGDQIIHFLQHLSFDKISLIITMQSYFLVGVYYFKKNSFIKVCLCLVAYFLIAGAIFAFSHKNMLNGGSHTIFWGINIINDSAEMQINNGSSLPKINTVITTILNIMVPIGLWVVSFLKLRETEI